MALEQKWYEQLPTEPLRVAGRGLEIGIKNRSETITWRTMCIEMRRILGSQNPERVAPQAPVEQAYRLVDQATAGTYFHSLTPEILYSLGYQEIEPSQEPIEALIINARHGPESMLWNLADYLAVQKGFDVGVINPVGHYRDHEPRILGPRKLLHHVDTAVFLTSTQSMNGGSVSVLSETIGLLRNREFSSHIKNVAVVIPMFAGMRGHRLGQSEEIGYEVLQAESLPARLAAWTEDIRAQIAESAPHIAFYSIDIHNVEMPLQSFQQRGFEFENIGPEQEFAQAVRREVSEQQLYGIPLRLVAVDKGAVERTESLAMQILLQGANGHNWLDLIQIKKTRGSSGEVDRAEVETLTRMSLEDGEIIRQPMDISQIDPSSQFVRVTSDDILDTGSSAKQDDRVLDAMMPNCVFKISVVTHPVMSEGIRPALNNTGSDVVIIGNTLTNNDFYKDGRIRVVDLSPSVGRKLFGSD